MTIDLRPPNTPITFYIGNAYTLRIPALELPDGVDSQDIGITTYDERGREMAVQPVVTTLENGDRIGSFSQAMSRSSALQNSFQIRLDWSGTVYKVFTGIFTSSTGATSFGSTEIDAPVPVSTEISIPSTIYISDALAGLISDLNNRVESALGSVLTYVGESETAYQLGIGSNVEFSETDQTLSITFLP